MKMRLLGVVSSMSKVPNQEVQGGYRIILKTKLTFLIQVNTLKNRPWYSIGMEKVSTELRDVAQLVVLQVVDHQVLIENGYSAIKERAVKSSNLILKGLLEGLLVNLTELAQALGHSAIKLKVGALHAATLDDHVAKFLLHNR
jgi:hypothetical protein